MHIFENFNDLYAHFNKTSIGYLEQEEANPLDMEKYYSKEEQKKYNVLGIEIETLKWYVNIFCQELSNYGKSLDLICKTIYP